MSRAFVKESEFEEPQAIITAPAREHPNYITAAGLARLQERVAEALRADAESHEAQRLQARVDSAVVVELAGQPRDRVAFGATVTLGLDDGGEQRWRIVGEDEAAAAEGSIAWTSPLARALAGKQVGDVATWSRPAGDCDVKIVAIRYAG